MPEDTQAGTVNPAVETKPNDPGSTTPGKSDNDQGSEAHSQIPDNLRGKSPEQLAQMYTNLEKKLGDQSKEVGEVRKLKQDMDVVLQAIWKDPNLYQQVERQVLKIQGKASDGLPEIKPPGKSGDDGDKGSQNDDSDVRRATQTQVISTFEKSFKLDTLPKEQRESLNKKIAFELSEILDPSGKKTVAQIIAQTPVDQLPKYLEKAYWLARKDTLVDRGSDPSELDLASIGGMSANTGKSSSHLGLTPEELRTAEKLGVSPEKYAKNKKK